METLHDFQQIHVGSIKVRVVHAHSHVRRGDRAENLIVVCNVLDIVIGVVFHQHQHIHFLGGGSQFSQSCDDGVQPTLRTAPGPGEFHAPTAQPPGGLHAPELVADFLHDIAVFAQIAALHRNGR